MNATDLDAFAPWLERRDSAHETLSPVPAACLAATLDLPEASAPAGTLPPLWHWLHFFDQSPSASLGDDGSPRTRKLLPPITLPQIMWAGSEVTFVAPLRLNAPASRTSRILDMSAKDGSRGPMVFVTFEHRIEQDGQAVVIDHSRTVFLGPAREGGKSVADAAPTAERERSWRVDEPVLFRFSALTFNPHRIHYDHPYATKVAGYPGLVVHGPLQAILLAETFREWQPRARVRRIAFRAKAPRYLPGPVVVGGAARGEQAFELWTCLPGGGVAMQATVEFDRG